MGAQVYLSDRTTLITGGTGTLGQEITKQSLPQLPKLIKVYSRGELLQAEMKAEFGMHDNIRYIIGDVRDYGMLYRAINKVDFVIHTAALKRVESCEENPDEAVATNVHGTQDVISACLNRKVKRAILISSDKAVQPINIYGTTKLAAEKLFIKANTHGGTLFSVIRFGNFYGSRGSLVTEIEKQLRAQGEIRITALDMMRYWITIEKAAKFTLECLGGMEGGEIFVPKMEQFTVREVLDALAPDMKIKIVGKRPGEKQIELLFAEGEQPEDCGDYWRIK